ncbi:TPA: pyridoxal-phosphate dependent enzyme [Yersinia enterocolitica]|nr:pyridoxal-phosphate dependent enzyme [Yersinia enterocolitica]
MNTLFNAIKEAHQALRPQVRVTPLEYSPLLSQHSGCEIYLKCEHLQHTGSFKFRGASNKLRLLTDEQCQRGVITASTGNHGQAMALAGKLAGVKATIYAPEQAAAIKLEAIRALGGEVELIPGDALNAELAADSAAQQQGKIYISPYNDRQIIAGQGTCGMEMVEQQHIRAIGIVGTGMQARLHLMYLKSVISCRQLWVWGRSETALEEYRQYAEEEGFEVNTTLDAAELGRHCQFIVTTTPGREAILHAVDIQPGTHITAVGADGAGKHELTPELVAKADKILVDSWAQCTEFGEISSAFQQRLLAHHTLTEMGTVLAQGVPFRDNDQQITLADLTGLGIQDVQIVKGILMG